MSISVNDLNPADAIRLELVSLDEESAKLIMEWRNDDTSRSSSFDARPKQWPQFFDEFKDEYFRDPTLPCYFIRAQNKLSGFIRFRRLPELINGCRASDISINLAPLERGKGLAAQAISRCVQIARNAGIELVIADIKPTNTASIAAFEKAGFCYLLDVEQTVKHSSSQVTVKRFGFPTYASGILEPSNRKIGPGNSCFVIAEAGSNWRVGTPARDIKMARALIDVAAEAGADAVKFQTYQPSTTYVSNAGKSDYLSDSGIKDSITDIFADLAMPPEMLPELAKYAAQQNILFMSSPFSVADFRAVDPYVQMHKIASYEISHIRLIEAIAKSNKCSVLSTGASDLNDIEWAVRYFQSISKATLCLMQCTARYPAPLSSLNLGTIPLLKYKFGLPVGLSDHTRDPITGPLAAVALGANLIEKHYTLDNRLPGPDHAFAILPVELKEMVVAVRRAESVVGPGSKIVQPEEEELYWYARRGLQATKDIQAGEKLLEGINFDILRPGKQKRGAHPRVIERAQNFEVTRKILLGDGIQLNDIGVG